MSESKSEGMSSFVIKYWWINLARGAIAIALGISLLLNPDEARASVLRYMGLYWLASGVLNLLWGASRARVAELWLATGLVELIGGGMILLFPWFAIFDVVTVVHLFGLIALTTGLLHIIAGMVVRHRHGPGWSLGSFMMGVLQFALGVLVLTTPEGIHPLTVLAASAWAFVGGAGLISVSLRARKLAARQQ